MIQTTDQLLTLRGFPPALQPCSEVVPQPLRSGLADVKLNADCAQKTPAAAGDRLAPRTKIAGTLV